MRNAITFFALVLSCAIGLADVVWAHGGSYQGPAGGGTPGYTGPVGGGTTGPTGGGTGAGAGGTTGPTGGGTTGPSGGGGPTGPGLRPTGAGAGGRGGAVGGRTTGGRVRAKGTGNRFNDWDWWWELNDEPFLNLKRKLFSDASASENSDSFLGAKMEDNPVGITLAAIRRDILPTLKVALKDPFFDARSGASIAIAKVSDAQQTDIIQSLTEMLGDEQRTVREAACLGLGILGSKEAVPILMEVAKNTPKGKRLVKRGGADILNRTRAFACVAMGIIGWRNPYTEDEGTIQELVRMISERQGADPDLQVGPALALGLIESDVGVPQMLEVFKNTRTHEYVRAHVAVALGKIGAKAAMRTLLQGMKDKSNHVKRSCAISLGLLGTKEDKEVIRALRSYAGSASDRGHKNFCLVALGQIGAPEGIALLRKNLRSGQVHDRTFSALGLGVYSFKSGGAEPEIAEEMLKLFNKTKATSERGCYAIVLGLMGNQDAKESLRKALEVGGSQDLKGHVCTALGLLSDSEAIPQVREMVAQVGDTDLRRRAAIALGLMRDTGAVEVLRKVIEESGSSKGVLGAATVGLGFIGDRSAVPILKDFLKGNQGVYKAKDVTRAFATVALGFLGDKDEIPVLSNLQRSSNYLAQTSGLAELLAIL